ncbi:MAG: PAS domain S-box protein [Verrucomicrobiae bacterium]|nr:PAS domain S-box protein [Verrucomicrobiae bacterium]
MRILYVEDNPDDAELARHAVRTGDPAHRLEVVPTLARARARLAEARPPDVVLLDMSLPDGNGMELLGEIRDQRWPIAVVVLTQWGDEATVVAALRSGADDYLSKRDGCWALLVPTLEGALVHFRREGERRACTIRVLYAEPAGADAELTQRHFQQQAPHIELEVVPDGNEVCARLASGGVGTEGWDVLLLDYQLPGDNAIEVLKRVRIGMGLDIPVVVVTGQGSEEVAIQAMRLGASEYFRKEAGYLIRLPHAIERAHHQVVLARQKTALVESEARFRGAFESSSIGIALVSPSGRWLQVNRALCSMLGYSEAELLGSTFQEITYPEDLEADLDLVRQVLSGARQQYRMEKRYLHKDGSILWALLSVSLVRDGKGQPLYFVSQVENITERKAAELKLREEVVFSETLLSNLPAVVGLFREDGRMLRWNRRLEEVSECGPEEIAGMTAMDFLAERDWDTARARIREAFVKGHAEAELTVRRRTGGEVPFLYRAHRMDVDGHPCLLVVGVDISEKKRLEGQILQAQRLESLGTLAGGIAHDLNNMLAPILLSVDLLRSEKEEAEAAESLRTIERSARRAAEMVRQVLSFARGMEGQRISLSLLHVLRDVQSMVRETIPKCIRIELRASEDLWCVVADPTQLHQVFLNLYVNARDAMPQGGTLRVTIENVMLDELQAGLSSNGHPGPHVVARVTDTGTGMPREVRDRVFDPFFTTKPVGKGTGLGLSTAMGIVRSHGGWIHLESELGKGTTFHVYFPAERKVSTVEPEEPVGELPRGQGEVILVADDEPGVCSALERTLVRHGYEVLVAGDGADAIALFAQHRQRIAVVLLDMLMPVMDGTSTVGALRAMDPEVRILGASGHVPAEGAWPKHGGLVGSVPKPFTAAEILRELDRILRRG